MTPIISPIVTSVVSLGHSDHPSPCLTIPAEVPLGHKDHSSLCPPVIIIPEVPAQVPERIVLKIPFLQFPSFFRSIDLPSSIIYQIDALSCKVLGPNARIEADLFAPNPGASFTRPFSFESAYDDLASFNCLFFHDLDLMPEIIALAASHKAFGVFIVPVRPDDGPLILHVSKSSK